MKLKNNWKRMEMAGEIIAVPTDPGTFNGVIKLNESAAIIFDLLQIETSEDSIVADLLKTYSAEPEVLRNYVHEFIQKLDSERLLG